MSLALVDIEPELGGIPESASQYSLKYFLEVFIAKEFLVDWVSTFDGVPTDQERVERVVHYAIYDA